MKNIILGFFKEDSPYSITRLCMFLLIITVMAVVIVSGLIKADYSGASTLSGVITGVTAMLKVFSKMMEKK